MREVLRNLSSWSVMALLSCQIMLHTNNTLAWDDRLSQSLTSGCNPKFVDLVLYEFYMHSWCSKACRASLGEGIGVQRLRSGLGSCGLELRSWCRNVMLLQRTVVCFSVWCFWERVQVEIFNRFYSWHSEALTYWILDHGGLICCFGLSNLWTYHDGH